MTEKELLDSVKRDSGRNEEEIREFCERLNITLMEYRAQLDRAMIARGWLTFDSDGNRVVKIPESTVKHLKQDNN
jgi:hypothetical protein